jgi:Histidine kinase-, DNA gyrase B-, and HSP90-like ATPase
MLTSQVTYGGSGLGLFISKSLAEMHGGGCIGVRSQSGVGSTFAFFIGIRVAEDQANEASTKRPIVRRQQSIEARIKSARYSVLLVEDNLINVCSSNVMFRSVG